MLTRLTVFALCVAAFLFPLGQIIAEAEEPTPSYDSFLEDHEQSVTTPPATWSVSPGQDGAIEPVDVGKSYELLRDTPLGDLDTLDPQLPDAILLREPDEPLDLPTAAQSNDNLPPDEPSSRDELVRTILVGLVVGLIGALAGVGLAYWRIKHGNRPGPARKPRIFR